MLRLRFYRDPETGQPHIHRHDVTEHEVEDVLRQVGEDRWGRGSSRAALGRTRGGRYLRIVYLRDPDAHSLFVVTAYELQGKPLTAYKRRQRKKRR